MKAEAKGSVYFFGKKNIRGKGLCLSKGMCLYSDGTKRTSLFAWEDFPLKGNHNLENMLAASLTALLLGVKAESIRKTLRSFKALPHRIEPLGQCRGVSFINDSKSTTVDSTVAALRSVAGPVVLLAGGRDKGAPFDSIERVLEKKTRCAVFYGEARRTIAGSFKRYHRYRLEEDFRKAVRLAFRSAKPGDSVLLSPMCTSFDQFGSYGERGNVFREVVKTLGVS